MSRRKQTTPNKVHSCCVSGGPRNAMQYTDEDNRREHQLQELVTTTAVWTTQNSDGAGGLDPQWWTDLQISGGSDDEETTQDEVSSHTSEEDGSMVHESLNADPMLGLSQCPLCQLECGSREQLIAHVYQHTAAVVSAKSYMCPVCGRALSSPGSLGRHLLIHSEDQLSNCAVCGARFTSHATFNSEKLPEVLSADRLPAPQSEGPSSVKGRDIAFHTPVYPAGILLVCNNCAAYRKLLEAQTPGMRKWALRRQNEPLEVRLQRLERERTAKKSRRDNETPEEREVRRMRDREAKRLQRMQETDEQRARRLQRDREAMRLKRANETPEKRQARLIREREAKRLKRRLEKMDMMLRAQFGQDPSAMAALAAEMNFFQLPVSNVELESQLLGKMTFEEQSNSALH
ncbi:zinc finger protein 821 [Grus japonensis]|uniref:Zinc finger protein 821 n=1 Tax=Grus japonensis TaxID=30415 RepID=A0ABC9XD34_GRUJA